MSYRRGDYKKARRGAFGMRLTQKTKRRPERIVVTTTEDLVEVAIAVDEMEQSNKDKVQEK